jgi:UDP-N-acetyl-D-glucosamine dehydrogenase
MSVVPLPFCLCEERFRFTGFDIDPYKVETLNRGGSYIVRIPGAQIQ